MKKKTLGGGIVGLILSIVIGVGGYFAYEKFGKISTPPIVTEKPVTSNTKTINFETTALSKARAVQFDVGQGDAGLVQVSKDADFRTKDDNFNILVDFGVENQSPNTVKEALVDKLLTYDVKNIDLLVISHLHFDHIGAVKTLVDRSNKPLKKDITFKNSTVLFNFGEAQYGLEHNNLTATAKKALGALRDKKVTFEDSRDWSQRENINIVDFGQGNFFSVIGTSQAPAFPTDHNAWSLVNKFQWGSESILYTGDLASGTSSNKDDKWLERVIPAKNMKELKATILKSPHHGSFTNGSNSKYFIDKLVDPNEVWISAGDNDKYTLPDVDPIKRYAATLKRKNIGVDMIKGTRKFGKTREEIIRDNPKDTQKEIDVIVGKWKPLNDWVKQNPTVNNNNKGYGNIVKEFGVLK